MSKHNAGETTTPQEQSARYDSVLAWKVLLNPRDYGDLAYSDLLKAGFDAWADEEGSWQAIPMVNAAEKFALQSIREPTEATVRNDPWFDLDHPGQLAVCHALGAVLIKRNDRLEDDAHRITLHHYLREVFKYHVFAALDRHPNRVELLKTVGEAVLGRNLLDNTDKYGPPPGTAILGVEKRPDFGPGLYFKVALNHARDAALIRNDASGEIVSRIDDNAIFVPMDSILEDYGTYLVEGLRRNDAITEIFEEALLDQFSGDGPINQMKTVATDLDEKVKRLIEAGQTEKLLEVYEYDYTLKCLLEAVDEAPNDMAKLATPLSAQDIHRAIQVFRDSEPEDFGIEPGRFEGKQRKLERFSSPRAVGNYLQKHRDHDDIRVIEKKEGESNKYELRFSRGHFEQINVEKPSDIENLPCVSNVIEHLQERDPNRYLLYSLVRISLSVDAPYNYAEHEERLEVLVDWFENLFGNVWFDREVTRYQIDYEMKRTIAGTDRKPNPIGCNCDTEEWKVHCIGLDECSMSIYNSLPMKQEVYDRLDG